MNIKRVLFAMALTAALAAGTANAQFVLIKSVVGNGGSLAGNGTFTMDGTIGQPAIGYVTGGGFQHGIGFWYPNLLVGSVDVTPGYAANGNTLYQNFPNPFRSATTIRFSLARRSDVVLKVFNMPGQEVAVVADGSYEAGEHEVTLDKEMSSGTYFYQLQVDNSVLRRQMVVAK